MVDTYMLRLLARPLAVSLAVVMSALLLERLVRLFELLAERGGGTGMVFAMAVNLVPHYLGLALPAAFCFSMLSVILRMCAENEMDALEGSGLSIQRIAVPYIGVGVVLAMVSVALFGYIQPYSRYAFSAIKHALINSPWDAQVIPGTFIDTGNGLRLSALEVGPEGRKLQSVFVFQVTPDETGTGTVETAITAKTGELVALKEAGKLVLTLKDGITMPTSEDGGTTALGFSSLDISKDYSADAPIFRPRGLSEREMTLDELWNEAAMPGPADRRARMLSEFHARLVRGLSLIFLPLLAVPMGLSAKRTPRWESIALTGVIIIAYHQSIQLLEGFGDLQLINPGPAIWGLGAAFGLFCSWLFFFTKGQGQGMPLRPVFKFFDHLSSRIKLLIPQRFRTQNQAQNP
jgi:lipopolysaccharide export system permease protein